METLGQSEGWVLRPSEPQLACIPAKPGLAGSAVLSTTVVLQVYPSFSLQGLCPLRSSLPGWV